MSSKTYEIITAKMVEAIEKGESFPWRKPWGIGNRDNVQSNLATKTRYKGINAILTTIQNYPSPYWLTYKQGSERRLFVRKGEKGTPIVYWLVNMIDVGTNEKGETLYQPNMKPLYYTAFNLSQFQDWEKIKTPLSDLPKEEPKTFDPIEEGERIIQGYKDAPSVRHGGNKACYYPSLDIIDMPPKVSFISEKAYYGTLFHEYSHSTGHSKRLSRKGITESKGFGTKDYSFEELVAEISSSFLCNHAGINADEVFNNSVAYISNWLKVLKNDSSMLPKAAQAAQKAANLILGIKEDKGEKEEPSDDKEETLVAND